MRGKYGEPGEQQSATWMERLGIAVEPVTLAQAQIATDAFARYRGRPARLNMGDCFAYALARSKGIALLYKGDDFDSTDIRAA
jgi:ribonuclease VapC